MSHNSESFHQKRKNLRIVLPSTTIPISGGGDISRMTVFPFGIETKSFSPGHPNAQVLLELHLSPYKNLKLSEIA